MKVASDVPESNYYVMKEGVKKANENWAMLNMFLLRKAKIEARKKEAARRKHAIEIQILKKTRRGQMCREKKNRRIKNIG